MLLKLVMGVLCTGLLLVPLTYSHPAPDSLGVNFGRSVSRGTRTVASPNPCRGDRQIDGIDGVAISTHPVCYRVRLEEPQPGDRITYAGCRLRTAPAVLLFHVKPSGALAL